MKYLKFILSISFLNCVIVQAESVSSAELKSTDAHKEAEDKAAEISVDELKHKSRKYVILWQLCPSYELTKDQVKELVSKKTIDVDSEWITGTISLKEGHHHPALDWAKDTTPDLKGEEKEFFEKEQPLLLESGDWDGKKLVYHYRWPGDLEKGKSIVVTADITVKDVDSDKGKYLNDVFNRIKHEHDAKAQPAAPTTVVVHDTKVIHDPAPPPVVVHDSTPVVVHDAPYYYPGYIGPSVVIGGGWYGHRHRW